MILSIDHGNKLIKTNHHVFPSNLITSNTVPPLKLNTIFYDGRYHSLSGKRIPYMRDKTENEKFYVLTLMAIALELQTIGKLEGEGIKEITLLTGLPPAHYGKQYKNFEAYFLQNKGLANFIFKDKQVAIEIKKAISYPQAYAAAMSEYERIRHYPKAVIVDIGGYTLDYIFLNNGKPDLSLLNSLENGIITMYNHIISKINASTSIILDEMDIDAIIKEYVTPPVDFSTSPAKPQVLVDKCVKDAVIDEVAIFTNDFIGILGERKLDLTSNLFVFVGGGSILLQRFIEQSAKIKNMLFIDDIKANVTGYEILYHASN